MLKFCLINELIRNMDILLPSLVVDFRCELFKKFLEIFKIWC